MLTCEMLSGRRLSRDGSFLYGFAHSELQACRRNVRH